MIKSISFTEGVPVMVAPLSFIIILTMIKDLYEDQSRKKSDKAENEKLVEINGLNIQW